MTNVHWSLVLVLAILAAAVGFLFCRLRRQYRDDIIKLEIRRDLLPEPGTGGPWIQGGSCFMGDGTVGIVKGKYCQQMNVL